METALQIDSLGEDTTKWKNSSRTVFHMGGNSTMEGFFRTFLKIMAASAMHVHGYETGNDIHALGIHHLGADNTARSLFVTSRIFPSLINTEPSFNHP